MIFNKLARLPLSYPNDLEGIHFVLDPNNTELNGVYVTANSGTPRLVASLDGSKWLVSGANTITPKYGKHIDASIIDNLDTVLNISSYMKTSDYVSVNGNTAIKHVDYALNSTNDRDGNNIINTYATKSEIPSLVEYVTKTYLNTYVEVKRGPDDNYVTAAEKIYWNAKQQALGFTPEMQGIAESLITTLKGGVSTEGDTLKKLYDLYISGYSEFTVPNIDARNNFNITKLPTNIFVLDDGDTKWALYKAITTGTNATYVKLSDPDLLNSVMTSSQIATSYESVADVNRFTDILKAKLDSITSIFTTELKTIYDGNTNWISTSGASLITNSHVHSNKSILDLIVGTSTGYLKMNGTGLVFDNSTFSQSNHTHNLNDLSEKSYNSLTSKPTLLSQFTNDLGNYGSFVTGTPWTGYGYLTSITGTQVTTALGYTPWHSGNHPNTISGYGITDIPTYNGTNFIQNQNSSAQSANMWISGSVTFDGANGAILFTKTNGSNTSLRSNTFNVEGSGTKTDLIDYVYGNNSYSLYTNGLKRFTIDGSGAATFSSTVNATQLQSTVASGTAPLTVNSTTMVSNLNAQYLGGSQLNNFVYGNNSIGIIASSSIDINSITPRAGFYTGYSNTNTPNSNSSDYGYINIPLWSGVSSGDKTSLQIGGTYGYSTARIRNINSSGIGTWYDIYHSGNLTNNLTTNYIPKWNGSSFVNSLISESGSSFILPDFKIYPDGSNIALQSFSSKDLSLNPLGNLVRITSTYQSTSPTTGALVVNGGVGVGGHIYSGGNVHCGNIIATSSNSNFISSDVSIGYSTYQGYRLAVNGAGYFSGTINATNYIGKSNGFYTVQITQAAYNALGTKDASTIYMIVG